jgi:hypothetical protein
MAEPTYSMIIESESKDGAEVYDLVSSLDKISADELGQLARIMLKLQRAHTLPDGGFTGVVPPTK